MSLLPKSASRQLGEMPVKSRCSAGWFRFSLAVADSFVCRCLISFTVPRFYTPLIEPDVQISRIRLSEEASRCRPRKTGGSQLEPNQSKLRVQDVLRELLSSSSLYFVFDAQPLS